MELTIIYGPPSSGKTRHVEKMFLNAPKSSISRKAWFNWKISLFNPNVRVILIDECRFDILSLQNWSEIAHLKKHLVLVLQGNSDKDKELINNFKPLDITVTRVFTEISNWTPKADPK